MMGESVAIMGPLAVWLDSSRVMIRVEHGKGGMDRGRRRRIGHRRQHARAA